jgi:hypothetical protein
VHEQGHRRDGDSAQHQVGSVRLGHVHPRLVPGPAQEYLNSQNPSILCSPEAHYGIRKSSPAQITPFILILSAHPLRVLHL